MLQGTEYLDKKGLDYQITNPKLKIGPIVYTSSSSNRRRDM